jgi:hypothetical protein
MGIKKAEKQTQGCCGSPMKFFYITVQSLLCNEWVENHRVTFQRNNKFLQLHSVNLNAIIYRINRRRKSERLLHAALCHSPHSKLLNSCSGRCIQHIVPDLSPCGGHRKIQFMWTIHTAYKNWNTILQEKLLIFQGKVCHVSKNIFRWLEVRLEAECQNSCTK